MDKMTTLNVVIDEQKISLIHTVMKLKRETGEHSFVSLSGILVPEDGTQESIIVPEMNLQILDMSGDITFRGIIRSVEIEVETVHSDPMRKLTLMAVSDTYLLDRHKKKRSFQKKAMAYKTIADMVLKDYEEAGIMMASGLDGISLGRPIIQYQETDWVFLKRLISRLNQPLIPDDKAQGPKLYAGLTGGGSVYEIRPDEESNVKEIYYINQGDEEGHMEYSWTSERSDLSIMGIGDMIRYKGVEYYIKSLEIDVEDSSVHHSYQFCLSGGFRVKEMKNPYITGLSLPGAVDKVSGDQVKVKLDIDAVSERDCWYTYSTFYSSFYCMPEPGDRVYLYMPSGYEEQAFVLNSIRDKPESDSQRSGSFQGIASSEAGITTEPAGGEAGPGEDNLLSWFEEVTMLPQGTLLGVGMGISDISVEGQQVADSQTAAQNGSVENAASYQGTTLAAAPSFDFQNLYNNENVKVLSTKDGKMVILDDNHNSVSIIYNDGTYLVLNKQGIVINAEGYLSLTAKGNINLAAEGAMIVSADETLAFICQDSTLVLNPEGVGINGTDVKINE